MALGEKIKGITIEFGGNTTKLDDALKNVKTRTRDVNSALKDINRSLKFDPTNTELLTQKQKELSKKVEATTDKLNALKAAEKQAAEALQKKEIGENEFDALRRDIIQTESDLRHFTGEYRKLGSIKLTELSQNLESMGTKIETVGHKLMPLSTAFFGIGVAAGKASIDFETAFTGVLKTVDGTPEQLDRIKQGILDLSQKTSSSANDIAAVAEAAGQLGIKTDDILSFTEVMIKLGDTTNLSAEEAATALAKYANITGLAANDYERLGSVIVDLGNHYATTEGDIVDFAMRIAGSGKQVGFTDQQIMALSASLSSVGLEAEAGGSAIAKVITQIDKDVALNADTLSTWANTAGLSVSDFKAAWEGDAYSALQKVVAGMGNAKTEGENLNVLLDELGITNIRTSDTMKRLSSASELMSDATETANKAWNENNALSNEAEKRYETTAAQLQQLKAAFVEMGVDLGEEFLPEIKEFVGDIKELTQKFKDLSPEAKHAVTRLIEIGAVAGPSLIAVGKMSQGLGTLAQGASKLSGMLKDSSGATNSFISAITSVNPVVAVTVASITGIVYAMYAYEQKVHAARNEVNELNAAQERYVDKVEVNAAIAEAYTNKIDSLRGVEEKSTEQKELMRVYVERLNASMEGLNLTYDEENDKLYDNTGKIVENTDAIRQQTEELKNRALADAYAKNSAEQLEKYVEFTEKASVATRERLKVEEDMNQFISKNQTLTETESTQLAALSAKYTSLGVDIDSYNEGMAEALRTSQKWNNMIEIQAGALDTLKESAAKAGIEIPASIDEGIKTGSYSIPSTIEDLQALITFDAAVQRAADSGIEIPNSLQAGILSGEVTVTEATAQINSLIMGEVNTLPGGFGAAGANAAQSMSDAMDANKGAVSDKAAEVIGGANAAAYLAAQQARSIGASFDATMAQGIEGSKNSVYTSGWSAAEYGREGSASVSFYNTGYNAGAGFANGLSAATVLVGTTASALAGYALYAARRRLDEHSPSKAFEKIGRFGGDGMAIGFSNSTEDVMTASETLAGAALIAARRRVSDFSNIRADLRGIVATRTAGHALVAGQAYHEQSGSGMDSGITYKQMLGLFKMLIAAVENKDMSVNLDGNSLADSLIPRLDSQMGQTAKRKERQ